MNPSRPLIDALTFPEVCQVCNNAEAEPKTGFACQPCRQNARRILPPWCDQCGVPFDGELGTGLTCRDCHEDRWDFDNARALYSASGLVREVIHRFKYHQHEYFEALMADWMKACVELPSDPPDCIVPIPLHPVKQRERGFNQAERIARMISGEIGAPVEATLLRRIRYTETQTNLSRADRIRNMNGAFQAVGSSRFNKILLVDDVLTTGATASACATALRVHGAAKINVLTLARGLSF